MLDDRFDPKAHEQRIYARWEEAGCFKPDMDPAKDPYCVVIPPPNVTGVLHIGHALNNTLQDILCRFERMRGKDVLWQPGTDHAGIATQMVVENQLRASGNQTRESLGRDAFIDKVWAWKEESGDQILEQLKRLGASCDWSRTRFTLDDGLSEAVTKTFVKLYEEGLIYRGKRLVNWDPHFRSAISDLEVNNEERQGHFWHFKYPLEGGETYTYIEKDKDGNVTLEEERDYISIATTRPETMLGDGAVAVHPDDERYKPLHGKMVRLPLADRLIPVIVDTHPDPDFGSGAVKITGAHDFNDHAVAKRHDLPMLRLMDKAGRMSGVDGAVPEKYVGLDRFEAREAVVADIDAQGLLIRVEDKKISQPIGDRSGAVIEPMLTDQWFCDAEALAGPAIEAAKSGAVSIVPESHRNTFYHWMENIQPWTISRQLWWGHRIPAWYGPQLSKPSMFATAKDRFVIVASSESEAVQKAKQHYDRPVSIINRSGIRALDDSAFVQDADPDVVFIYRDPDVLDTWFSSALWPFSTLGWPDNTEELKRFYPTSTLITGFDIIFFWVARMMMMGEKLMGEKPFSHVYVHALILDEDGKKMSKSEGNTIDPLDLIDGIGVDALVEKRTSGLRQPDKAPRVEKATRKQYPDGFEAYGADALRFGLAAQASMGRNIRLSVDRIAGYRNFGTKLWNAARFAEMNGAFAAERTAPETWKLAVNRWIAGEVSDAAAEIEEALESFRFDDAAAACYRFIWNVLCDWHVELVKPQLSGEDGEAKRETQAALAWALDQAMVMLHPFMPFLTEALWEQTGPRDGFLMKQNWPEARARDAKADAELDWVIGLIGEVRSARSAVGVPAGSKAPLTLVASDAVREEWLRAHSAIIGRMTRADPIASAETAPAGVRVVVGSDTVVLDVADLVDAEAEAARLAKEIAKLGKEVSGLEKKLGNEKFLSRAPEEVVEEQRTRLAAAQTARAKLQDAAEQLAGLG